MVVNKMLMESTTTAGIKGDYSEDNMTDLAREFEFDDNE